MNPYIVDTQLSILTTHAFLLYVSMLDTSMIIIMSFIATVVVHVSIANVIHTFAHIYTLLLLPIVIPWVS